MAEAEKTRDRDLETIRHTLDRIGSRVKAARKVNALSRKELSQRSGVSMRYLAQLESGEGNVSIAVLQRVAEAVEVNLQQLISDDVHLERELIAQRFETASNVTKNQIRQLLNVHRTASHRTGRICLIGLRGAGKTTLGERMGSHFDVPFIQLNRVIEEQAGMPITEILALYGPDGFRKLEAEALKQVGDMNDRLILEASGGIVSEPNTYAMLLERFHTIWIKATPDEHMNRVIAQGDTRPMSGNPEAMEQLKQLLKNREAQYGKADQLCDTSGQTLQTSIQQLVNLINSNSYLEGVA